MQPNEVNADPLLVWPGACKFEGCGRGVNSAIGLCPGHKRQLNEGRELRPLASNRSRPPSRCLGPECSRAAVTKGVCGGHYSQQKRGLNLVPLGTRQPGNRRMYDGILCYFDGCGRPAKSRGLCGTHREMLRREGALRPVGIGRPKPPEICEEPSCGEEASRGRRRWCPTHYRQYLEHGRTKKARSKDGRFVGKDGYVMLKRPGHSEASTRGWGPEHRIVMSDHLGRPLWPDENVHHKNGDRADNRIANLELWSRSQPSGQRVTDKLAWAHEIIERYGSDPNFA